MHLAHRFALESPQVTADMVEAAEYPHLVQKYDVMGVPKTIVNERHAIEGAVPEKALLAKILEAADGGREGRT